MPYLIHFVRKFQKLHFADQLRILWYYETIETKNQQRTSTSQTVIFTSFGEKGVQYA